MLWEDQLALLVALLAAAALVSSRMWTRAVPKLFWPKIIAKEREVAVLQKETDALSSVAQFTQHSKNSRQLTKMRQELDALRAARRSRGWLYNNAPYLYGWIIQLGLLLPLLMLYGDLELVMLPDSATSFVVADSLSVRPLSNPPREINVGVWYLLVQFAMSFVLKVLRR